MQIIYLVVGVPGSGKSWVCEQLLDSFDYVPHDGFIGSANHADAHVRGILARRESATKPLLTEAPFSIRSIKDPLEDAGCTVVPLFILERPETVAERYRKREGKEIPQGHLTRMRTYAERCREYGAFSGTSTEVFERLKLIALALRMDAM